MGKSANVNKSVYYFHSLVSLSQYKCYMVGSLHSLSHLQFYTFGCMKPTYCMHNACIDLYVFLLRCACIWLNVHLFAIKWKRSNNNIVYLFKTAFFRWLFENKLRYFFVWVMVIALALAEWCEKFSSRVHLIIPFASTKNLFFGKFSVHNLVLRWIEKENWRLKNSMCAHSIEEHKLERIRAKFTVTLFISTLARLFCSKDIQNHFLLISVSEMTYKL